MTARRRRGKALPGDGSPASPPAQGLSRPDLASRARVLEHLLAGLLAAVALVGAPLHHLVGLVLRAGVAAALAGVGAALTDEVRERPGARRDAGGGGAEGAAVLAGLQRLEVLFLALGDELGAVGAAGVALARAGVAGLGAVHEVAVVL